MRIRPQRPTQRQETKDQVLAICLAITLLGGADEACDGNDASATAISIIVRSAGEVTRWFDEMADDY